MMPASWRVTAIDPAGVAVFVAKRIEDRRAADRLAWHWMGNGRIESVYVEREVAPAVAQGNGRFR